MTLDEVAAELDRLGIELVEATLPPGWCGAYSHRERTIYVQRDIAAFELIPTLLHELEHARLHHEGHQSRSVENAIDERVARELISPADYALAEKLHDGHTGGIALELDLPRWVVSAYRRQLWQGRKIA